MSKSQSSNVDGRCDGVEISTRDQRGRTSPSDRVKEDVSQEYFTCRNKFIYLSDYERSDELGGMAEIDLRMRTKANDG